MRIAIIGAGAMGSIFGAGLSAVSDVLLIDPNETHVTAIQENGLKISRPDGTEDIFDLTAVTGTKTVTPGFDLIIIFTKSRQTREAAKTALPLLNAEGSVLTLQNGIGNAEIIAEIIGEARTLAGVTSHGGTLTGPGQVLHAGEGPTHISCVTSDAPPPEAVAALFTKTGFETTVSDNLDSLIWGKLVINAGINALAAILRVPNGVLGVTPECEKIMAAAVDEAVAVAHTLGVTLPYDDPQAMVRTVCQNTAANKASMLQDTLRGTPTEIGVINRGVAEKGGKVGVDTPVNRFLADIMEAMDATIDMRCG